MKGEYQVATAQLNEAQLLYANLGDQAGLARTLINLGVVQYLNGDLPAATTTLTKALDLCRNLGDQAQEADALLSLAEVQSDFRGPRRRRGMGTELGTVPARPRQSAWPSLCTCRYQHHAAWRKRRPTKPPAAGLIRALQIFRGDLDDPRGEATALIDIGIIQRLRKEYAAAIANWEKVLAIFSELGAPLGQVKALYNLAIVKREMGNYPAATAYLTEALRLHHALGDEERQAELRDLLAEIRSKCRSLTCRTREGCGWTEPATTGPASAGRPRVDSPQR